jgi:membrane protease YdiL (CAAX protease family)
VAFRRRGIEKLGLLPRDVPKGLVRGALGILVVLPWVFWLMLAMAAIQQRYFPRAPTEHEIFKIWREPTTTATFRIVSMILAVVVAPLAEESLFRGLVQTVLCGVFLGRPLLGQDESPPPPAFLPRETEEGGAPVLEYETPPMVRPRVVPERRLVIPAGLARWLAIIVTSLIFAGIHQPAFIRPPIFLLSLGLGYVYERTGNLWSSIFMHMLFNGIEFSIFLSM